MRGLFVTGTGTGVGKTVVTALLSRQSGVCAVKPVLSGYDAAMPAGSDAGVLLAAAGRAPSPEAVAAIAPWRFAAPLSPDMAAAREGRTIDFVALVAWCRAQGEEGPLLVEGIGGAMVPLDDRHTVRDWIAALGLPALVVAGSYLGAISHALTTLAALRGVGVRVAAVVVSASDDSAVAVDETATVIARHGAVTVRVLPRLAIGVDGVPRGGSELTDLLG